MLKATKHNYENAKKVMSPDDPRMKMINEALWTYILKVIGLIPKEEDAKVVNELLQRLSSQAIYIEGSSRARAQDATTRAQQSRVERVQEAGGELRKFLD